MFWKQISTNFLRVFKWFLMVKIQVHLIFQNFFLFLILAFFVLILISLFFIRICLIISSNYLDQLNSQTSVSLQININSTNGRITNRLRLILKRFFDVQTTKRAQTRLFEPRLQTLVMEIVPTGQNAQNFSWAIRLVTNSACRIRILNTLFFQSL